MWFFANDCLQTSWGFCPKEEPESISSTPRHSSRVEAGQDKQIPIQRPLGAEGWGGALGEMPGVE